MEKDLEARIRTRAYHLWENDPSPEDKAEQHWEEARRQIEAEGSAGGEAQEQPVNPPSDQSAERDRAARITPRLATAGDARRRGRTGTARQATARGAVRAHASA